MRARIPAATSRPPPAACTFAPAFTPAPAPALALALVFALVRPPGAGAHVVVGARVFPVTLTFDDPGVGDEASIPSFTYVRGSADGGTGPTHDVDPGFEYDKTITPDTALILDDGIDVNTTEGDRTQTGFQNLFVTGKWQAITDATPEFVFSVGVIREIGGTATVHTGGDASGSTTPTAYFGKGFGDLPVGVWRAFAVTGELGYTVADRELKALAPAAPARSDGMLADGLAGSAAGLQGQGADPFNDGSNNAWAGSLSLQFSIPYLQSQIRDVGLRGLLGDMIPLVEFDWSAPASSPSTQGTTWTAAPGLIVLDGAWEYGLEALIPMNREAGTNIGAVGLVHVFFDDLFPHGLGAPLLP